MLCHILVPSIFDSKWTLTTKLYDKYDIIIFPYLSSNNLISLSWRGSMCVIMIVLTYIYFCSYVHVFTPVFILSHGQRGFVIIDDDILFISFSYKYHRVPDMHDILIVYWHSQISHDLFNDSLNVNSIMPMEKKTRSIVTYLYSDMYCMCLDRYN